MLPSGRYKGTKLRLSSGAIGSVPDPSSASANMAIEMARDARESMPFGH
jgi:hypothetical protein